MFLELFNLNSATEIHKHAKKGLFLKFGYDIVFNSSLTASTMIQHSGEDFFFSKQLDGAQLNGTEHMALEMFSKVLLKAYLVKILFLSCKVS